MVSMITGTSTGSNYPNKRKNDDPSMLSDGISNMDESRGNGSTNRSTTAVIFSPRIPNNSNTVNWTQCKNRLHTLLRQYDDTNDSNADTVLDDIATISTQYVKGNAYDVQYTKKLQVADQIVTTIETDVSNIMKQVQNVTSIVSSLEEKYNTLKNYTMNIQNEIDHCNELQQTHYNHIENYRHMIEQYQNDIDTTTELIYQKVPRLQQHISLYVSMTGIKWKYTDDNHSNSNNFIFDENNPNHTSILRGEIVSVQIS
jgi:gas vesicle protein